MHKVFELLDFEKNELNKVKRAIQEKKEQEGLDALKDYFKERSYAGFTFKNGTRSTFEEVRYLYTQISEIEKKHIFSVCEELSQNIFWFREPWDMERTQTPYQFIGEIDWEMNPEHDPEWTFMLNRQNYLNVLAQAYILTQDHRYTEIYCRLINDWLIDNSSFNGKEFTTWRSIDTGIRLRNWVKSLEVFLKDSDFPSELLADMIVSVKQHLQYLQKGWTMNRLQTNWVVLEGNGAFLGSLFFKELSISEKIREEVLIYLKKASVTQVTKEGIHWEQSYQYHNEVLLKLAEICLLAQRNKQMIPPKILEIVKSMSIAAGHFRKPNGFQENYGDSDREYMDELLYFLEQVTGLCLLDEKTVQLPNRFMLSHYGGNGKKEQGKGVFQKSIAFNEAGIFLMKESKSDVHLQFKCGFLGHGHGHDDLLHVSLFANGEDILIDSGRFSYEEEYHQRLKFKSQAYHNTPMVDGIEINKHKNCWDAEKVTHPVNAKSVYDEKYDFVEGGHLGYISLDEPVFTNRKVLFLKPNFLIIVDEFLGRGQHTITQNFHFKLPKVRLGKEMNQLIYESEDGRKYYMETFHSSEEQGRWRIENQMVSDDYNEQHSSHKASYCVDSHIPFSLCTFMSLDGRPLNLKPIDVYNEYQQKREKSTTSAFKIDDDKYIVINHHEDADSRRAYIVDGYQGYGRVILIEPEEQESVTRIY